MMWLAVGLGGALGSLARHALTQVIQQRQIAGSFPLGIFLINVLGSAAIGLLAGAIASGRLSMSDEARTFVMVGLLGGFTTFSTFSVQFVLEAEGGRPGVGIAYVLASVLGGIAAAWAGYAIGRSVT